MFKININVIIQPEKSLVILSDLPILMMSVLPVLKKPMTIGCQAAKGKNKLSKTAPAV